MVITQYYEVKVRYERIDDAGIVKKVTEVYIVSAFVSQDVEIAILSELSSYRDVEILSIKKVKIDQVIAVCDRDKQHDNFYRVRCAVLEYDDARDRTRKVPVSIIINAEGFDSAVDSLRAWQGAITRDIETLSISLCLIKGVLI